MKKGIKYFVLVALISLLLPLNIKAASGSAYFTGASSVKAGYTTTIRLGFNGSDKVAGVQYTITASGSLQIVSINGVNGASLSRNGNNVIQAVFSTEGLPSGTVWANIVVKVPSGSAVGSKGTLTISNLGMSLDNNPSTLYASNVSKVITVASTPIEVPVTPKSNDASLKELAIKNSADFQFNKDITNYSVTVGNAITALDLTVTPNDSKATYVVTGNENFVVGRNYVTIAVTAEDGTQKSYTIEVIRQPEEVQKEECPICEENKNNNEKLIWIIISSALALLLITETGYIIYDKKVLKDEN